MSIHDGNVFNFKACSQPNPTSPALPWSKPHHCSPRSPPSPPKGSPSRLSVPVCPFSAEQPGCRNRKVHGLGLVLCIPLQPLWAPLRPAGHPPASVLWTRYSLSCNLVPWHPCGHPLHRLHVFMRPPGLCHRLSQHSLAFHPPLFFCNAPTTIYHTPIFLIYPIFYPSTPK